MVTGNNITSENLITVKELINNWHIAFISKKKKKSLKNTGQLNRRPDWPATRLTRLKMTRFDSWPVLTRDPIDPTRIRPDPPVLPCLPISHGLAWKSAIFGLYICEEFCGPQAHFVLFDPNTLNKDQTHSINTRKITNHMSINMRKTRNQSLIQFHK